MKIHLKQIPHDGLHLEGEEDCPIKELQTDDIRCAGPLRYDLEVGISEGALWANGSLEQPVELRCVSCLETFPYDIKVPAFALHTELHGPEAVDLTPLMRAEPLAWSPTSGYAESQYAQIHHGCAQLQALREGGFKIVRGSVDELYDLARDPRELQNLAAAEPARSRDLGEALGRLVVELQAGTAEAAPLDDEARRALESLGYSWSPSSGPAPGPKRDPHEALRSMKIMAEADRSVARGDVPGAIASYRQVLDAEPMSVDARVRLAQLLVTQERNDEAAHLLAAAAAIAPKEPELRRRLGDAYFALARYRQALEAYDAGLALHPAGHDIRDARWRLLNQVGRHAQMLAEAVSAIAADPSDGMARYARALACCGRGSDDAYIAALKRELAQLPGDPNLEAALRNARAK
jgi:tetratricopeptide (TPR) repeat protein